MNEEIRVFTLNSRERLVLARWLQAAPKDMGLNPGRAEQLRLGLTDYVTPSELSRIVAHTDWAIIRKLRDCRMQSFRAVGPVKLGGRQ